MCDSSLSSALGIPTHRLLVARSAQLDLLFESHPVFLCCRRHSRHRPNALIFPEFACWQTCLELCQFVSIVGVFFSPTLDRGREGTYHLVNLLECAVLHLGQEEECPDRADNAGRKPNVAVFGTPV